jgi:hypothetical protein
MDSQTRSFMEARFGHDFSKVQIHNDALAHQSAEDIHAKAYTYGNNIVFGNGLYSPGSESGRRLLAHELTHVLQQGKVNASNNPTTHTSGHPTGSIQRWGWTEIKEKSYSVMISGIHKGRDAMRNGLKDSAARHLPSKYFPIADAIIDIATICVEVLIAVVMAIIGMAVGFGEGIIGMVQGLITLTYGVIKLLFDLIVGIFTNFDEVKNDLKAVWEVLRNLPAAFKSLVTDWLAKFEKAPSERQSLMIGELTGQVLALIGTFALTAGAAGSAAKTAATVDAAAATTEAAATGSDIATTAARTKPVLSVIKSGGGNAGTSATSAIAESGSSGIAGNTALKIAPQIKPVAPPLRLVPPLPAEAAPAIAAMPSAGGVSASAAAKTVSATAVATATATNLASRTKGKRPPFVLRLPQQKAPHLGNYRDWIGVLQSDPNYLRGNPAQLGKWHRAHRIGGSDAIPANVYERGHKLGLKGVSGERRIRVPDWSRTRNISMQVDHIIELQLTPPGMRDVFDNIFNYELLDSTSNVASRNIIVANTAVERAKQAAFDPSTVNQVLKFDDVQLVGGNSGERWSSDEIKAGDHLDFFDH